MGEITLRDGTREDLEFLFALLKASLGPYVVKTYGPWAEDEERSRFFGSTQAESHQIVERAGEPIGCLKVVRAPSEVRLQRVFLLPAFQNLGIGTRLIEEVLAEARAAGLPVRLRVFQVNPARRLYERLGFVVTGETDTHVYMEHPA